MSFVKFVENIGSRVINYSFATYDFLVFLLKCIGNMFLPSNYTKSSKIILIKQIYLSCIVNLFSFIFSALFLGSVIIVIAITFAINFNLLDQIGDLLVLLIINEFSPFFTTLFFTFAYSLSLEEKIYNIKKSKNDLENKVYIPNLINALVIVPLMALLFGIIMIISGYIVSSLYLNIDLITYKNLIINSISFENILVLLIKGSIFGFFSVLIPIYSGHIKKSKYNISKSVIKNLIIILSMLILIELLSMIVLY